MAAKVGILLVVLMLLQPSIQQGEKDCDCDYHSGGCVISKAPPEGNENVKKEGENEHLVVVRKLILSR